jgi:Tat protein translocase TatB subunit
MMSGFPLFLNMSGGEILIIVVVAYLILGPKKIPEVARMIGKGINQLRQATDDIKREINREIYNVKKEVEPDLREPVIPAAYKNEASSNSKESPDIKAEGQPDKSVKDLI